MKTTQNQKEIKYDLKKNTHAAYKTIFYLINHTRTLGKVKKKHTVDSIDFVKKKKKMIEEYEMAESGHSEKHRFSRTRF